MSGSPDPDISPWDPGRWAGRTLDDVAAAEPEAVRAWLTDPDAVPHGGESLSALLQRVRLLLADLPPGHTLAVVDAAIVRAATVTVLGAPPSAFWRIDAGPLTVTDLRGGPAQWTVRATGRPLETY